MLPRVCVIFGALSAAVAVGLGAYHVHGLEKFLAAQDLAPDAVAKKLHDFDVGVRYQMYHALGMVLVGLLAMHRQLVWQRVALNCFLAGTLLFCGGLYVPVLFGGKLPWFLVPIGGLAFIVGWVAVAIGALKRSPA